MRSAVRVYRGSADSSGQPLPLVLEPSSKTCRGVTREARAGRSGQARKPKRVVVPFSDSKPRLELSDARIPVPKLVIWAWLELGFVMVLFASAFYLILLSVVAAGNL